jgi:hypothetical protein
MDLSAIEDTIRKKNGQDHICRQTVWGVCELSN